MGIVKALLRRLRPRRRDWVSMDDHVRLKADTVRLQDRCIELNKEVLEALALNDRLGAVNDRLTSTIEELIANLRESTATIAELNEALGDTANMPDIEDHAVRPLTHLDETLKEDDQVLATPTLIH